MVSRTSLIPAGTLAACVELLNSRGLLVLQEEPAGIGGERVYSAPTNSPTSAEQNYRMATDTSAAVRAQGLMEQAGLNWIESSEPWEFEEVDLVGTKQLVTLWVPVRQ